MVGRQIFLTIEAMLGLKIDGFDQRLILDSPMIRDWLEWLKVEDMAEETAWCHFSPGVHQ